MKWKVYGQKRKLNRGIIVKAVMMRPITNVVLSDL